MSTLQLSDYGGVATKAAGLLASFIFSPLETGMGSVPMKKVEATETELNTYKAVSKLNYAIFEFFNPKLNFDITLPQDNVLVK